MNLINFFSVLNCISIALLLAIAWPLSKVNANPDAPNQIKPEIEPEKTITSLREKCNFQPDIALTEPPLLPLGKLNVEEQTVYFQISGSTLLNQEILNQKKITELIQNNQGKQLTKTEFIVIYQETVKSLNQLYLNEGYITSKVVPQENLAIPIPVNNVVNIPVIEGRLEEIVIINRGRLNQNYLCDRIQLGIRVPLNIIDVEEQLRLLKQNPLLSGVNGNLKNSGTVGLSILEVTVQESQPFSLNLSFDNYSPISLGSERMAISLGYKNLTGLGDELSATYYRSTTGGLNLADFSYRVPLNPMDGTLQLRAIPTWTKVTQAPFDQLDITATNPVYEISYRQPLVRNIQDEFALSLGFRYQTGETLGLGRPDFFPLGNISSSVIQFGQDYLHRDPDGLWFLRSQFNFGTAHFKITTNADSLPDDSFFSWLIQAQRLQQLTADQLLIIQADLQLTPNNLLPDYLYVIGGGESLRGYRQNARSADNGFRFSIEDRITLVRNEEDISIFEIAPFIDMGSVWNSAGNPAQLPSQSFLIGAGLGLIWNNAFSLNGLRLRFDYGIPIVNLTDKGNNLQDDGIYFQINYQPW